MQKLKLKDGQVIDILDGSKENYYQAPLSNITDFATLYSKLTEDDLSKFEIYTSADVLNAVYSDKTVSKMYPETVDVGGVSTLVAVIELKPADTVGKNIKELQKSQQLQNQAIVEMMIQLGGVE